MNGPPNNFAEFVNLLIDLLGLLIPLIFGLTLVFIVYKIFDAWILSGGDDTKVSEGKQVAVVGVIALVVMSSVWGILQLLRSSLLGI